MDVEKINKNIIIMTQKKRGEIKAFPSNNLYKIICTTLELHFIPQQSSVFFFSIFICFSIKILFIILKRISLLLNFFFFFSTLQLKLKNNFS